MSLSSAMPTRYNRFRAALKVDAGFYEKDTAQPERKLLAAMLARAFTDCCESWEYHARHGRWSYRAPERKSAISFIFKSPPRETPFSFLFLCDHLTPDGDAMAERIRQLLTDIKAEIYSRGCSAGADRKGTSFIDFYKKHLDRQ